jgi:APA family basic amino acid/polyamine antiporter
VIFGLARDGLGPAGLARVNGGGTPWTAMLHAGAVAAALAATGTFERLLSLAITFVLVIDGFMVVVLFRLRRRSAAAPFRVPLYPAVPLLFLGTYAALFLAAAAGQPGIAALAALVLGATYVLGSAFDRR